MPWLANLFHKLTHKNFDLDAVKAKIADQTTTTGDLINYVDDLEYRAGNMVQDLKTMYKKYNITFNGFKSFDMAFDYLRESIKDGSEKAYNNLIKLESMVTSEQQRHLSLIKMAVTTNGVRVIDQIRDNPQSKATFDKIFGERDAQGHVKDDGLYQRLWSEIHKLSEYILIQKDKVYH